MHFGAFVSDKYFGKSFIKIRQIYIHICGQCCTIRTKEQDDIGLKQERAKNKQNK